MLKRFVPQKPALPIREEPRNPVPDESHQFASREETPPKPNIIDNPNPNPKPNPMADHGGKDILSSDVEIKGSIKFQKELLIDGKVEGDINSDGVLTVGENAEIRGEIKTKSISVYGKVHGNITVTERCELKSKCVLQGDLKAARLVIEEGATFIGKSEVTTGAVPAKAASRPEVVRSSEPIKAAFGVRA
jgi:cytoskeletal protein CcmA (bactofilin family)